MKLDVAVPLLGFDVVRKIGPFLCVKITVNGTLVPNNDVRPDMSILSLVWRVGNDLPLHAVAASPSEEHKIVP